LDYRRSAERGLAVELQQVITMAITIATGVRMRIEEGGRFGLFYDDDDDDQGRSVDSMKRFQRQLIRLAEFKSKGNGGGD